MKYYKINLSPVGPFFFGKELQAELGNRHNYFQESLFFPQQTTLLGMLRHQLLLKNGKAFPIVNKSTNVSPTNLIGDAGFRMNASKELSYGFIKSISPLFLQKDQKGHYFLFDKHWDDTKKGNPIIPKGNPIELKVEKEKKQESFSAKTIFGDWLLNMDDPADKVALGSIKKATLLTGNTKSWLGEADDKSYYRHRYQSLANITEKISNLQKTEFQKNTLVNDGTKRGEWSFSLYVAITTGDEFLDATKVDNTRLVTMGKEQSMFQLKVEALTGELPDHWKMMEEIESTWTQGMYRITFLSDTYARLIPEKSKLSIIDTQRFRSFTRDYNKNTNYYSKPNWKQHACNLIKKGSVIYTENPEEIVKEVVSHKEFRQIGYNYFQVKKIS